MNVRWRKRRDRWTPANDDASDIAGKHGLFRLQPIGVVMLCVSWCVKHAELPGTESQFGALVYGDDLVFWNLPGCTPKVVHFVSIDPGGTADQSRGIHEVRCASGIYINLCPVFSGPSPSSAGVVKVNMRGQKMTYVSGLKSEFSDTLNHRIEYRFRAAVYQEQFIRSAFDERNTNDIRCSEVECINEVNHPEH